MNLADICKELQNCFIKVRHFTFVDDQELLKDALDRIRDYEKYIIDKQLASECPILVYCIKTLFETLPRKTIRKCMILLTLYTICRRSILAREHTILFCLKSHLSVIYTAIRILSVCNATFAYPYLDFAPFGYSPPTKNAMFIK